ncbi:MAG: cobalamin-binding protein [Planctomycetes bacterium]|nr:cobalamin-binding protein [Planctomycetota bacterium]
MKRLVALWVLLAGCEAPRDPPPERYDRIVSIVPSVTEMLFAVGAGEQVVGVTTYCAYPPEAQSKEKVGDLTVNVERIVALKPDVVMTAEHMTRDACRALDRFGIRVLDVTAESLEEIAGQLQRLGRLTGHREQGEEAARRLLDRVRVVEEGVRGKPMPTVFVEFSSDPIWSVSSRGYAGDVIRRAGGRNIVEDLAGAWGAVSWEVVLSRDPDVILVAHDRTADVTSRPGWSGLKAVKGGRVHVVPKEAFVYPTARLADGLELAARLLHEAR